MFAWGSIGTKIWFNWSSKRQPNAALLYKYSIEWLHGSTTTTYLITKNCWTTPCTRESVRWSLLKTNSLNKPYMVFSLITHFRAKICALNLIHLEFSMNATVEQLAPVKRPRVGLLQHYINLKKFNRSSTTSFRLSENNQPLWIVAGEGINGTVAGDREAIFINFC